MNGIDSLNLGSPILPQTLRQDQDTTVNKTEKLAADTSPEVPQPDTSTNVAVLLDSLKRNELELSGRPAWKNANSSSIWFDLPQPTAKSTKLPLLAEYRRGSDKKVHGPDLSNFPYPSSKIIRELDRLRLVYRKLNVFERLVGPAAIAAGGVLATDNNAGTKERSRTSAIILIAGGGTLLVSGIFKNLICNRSLDKRIEEANMWIDAYKEVADLYNKRVEGLQKERAVQRELKKDQLAAIAECIPLNDRYMTMNIFNKTLKDEISGIKWAIQEIQDNEDRGKYMELEEMKARVGKLTARAREINGYCAAQSGLFNEFKAEQKSTGEKLRGFDLECLTTGTAMKISAMKGELPKFTDFLYFAESKNIGEERIEWDRKAQSAIEAARSEQEKAKDMLAIADTLLNKYINILTTDIEKNDARPDLLKMFRECAKSGNYSDLKDRLGKIVHLVAKSDEKLGPIEQEALDLEAKEKKLFDEQFVPLLGELSSIADAPSEEIPAKIDSFRLKADKEVKWFMLHAFIASYIKDLEGFGPNLKVVKTLLSDKLNSDGTWDLQFVVRDSSDAANPVEKPNDIVRASYEEEKWEIGEYIEENVGTVEPGTWIEFNYAKRSPLK